jgi:ElaB/YqjD/DUF883 family membrane-anchored ribosome-binding protein
MARDRLEDLNETNQEAPGGTQATHSASNVEFGELAEDLGEATRNTSVQSDLAMDGATGARARLQARARPVVRRAGHAVETGSDYLRTHDFDEIRGDLEREIRAHPIKSLAIALGTGYLLGKLFK